MCSSLHGRLRIWRHSAAPLKSLHWHASPTRSFWRFYTRLQLQNAITQRSYKTYEFTLFGATALLLLIVAIVGWLHIVLRTKTHFRWQW